MRPRWVVILAFNLGPQEILSGLKLTKIEPYSRTRGLFLPTVGETFALDTRLGSFVGLGVSAFEIETGVDVLYHSISASGLTLPMTILEALLLELVCLYKHCSSPTSSSSKLEFNRFGTWQATVNM